MGPDPSLNIDPLMYRKGPLSGAEDATARLSHVRDREWEVHGQKKRKDKSSRVIVPDMD